MYEHLWQVSGLILNTILSLILSCWGFSFASRHGVSLHSPSSTTLVPTIYFCFIDYAKPFDCVDHNELRKILQEMGIPDHLTCFLRNLYVGQEATVRTGHGTTDWFQIGKGVRQGCILSPCLFNFNAEYITRNAGLDETQGGIKSARGNINTSLR